MAILSITEIIDIIIMSVLIGYIFSGYFARFNLFRKPRDYVAICHRGKRFFWSDFLFSISLVGPAILLHELGHKFIAMSFGYEATFHSPISLQHIMNPMLIFTDFFALLMIIAVISTYFGSSFLFFIPAYVAFSAQALPIQQSLIAFSGPLVNLVLWQGSEYLVKSQKMPKKYVLFGIITGKINKLLFIFNMIPIPGFDGYHVLRGILTAFF